MTDGRFITEFFAAIHQGKNSGINWMRFFFGRGHFRTVVRWEFRRLVLIAEDITRLRFMPLSKVVRGDESLRLKIAARRAARRFRIVLQEIISGRSRFMFWYHLRSKNKSWGSFELRSLVQDFAISQIPDPVNIFSVFSQKRSSPNTGMGQRKEAGRKQSPEKQTFCLYGLRACSLDDVKR